MQYRTHYGTDVNGVIKYRWALCNVLTVRGTPFMTRSVAKVTCENCRRMLAKGL